MRHYRYKLGFNSRHINYREAYDRQDRLGKLFCKWTGIDPAHKSVRLFKDAVWNRTARQCIEDSEFADINQVRCEFIDVKTFVCMWWMSTTFKDKRLVPYPSTITEDDMRGLVSATLSPSTINKINATAEVEWIKRGGKC